MNQSAHTTPTPPDGQREQLLDSEQAANAGQPRNFKPDAIEDKQVRVEPDGTGPTSTKTFDAPADQARGSGGGGGGGGAGGSAGDSAGGSGGAAEKP